MNGFRADTFAEYMKAPCGRLLTILVLKDLGYIKYYGELRKKARKELFNNIKNGCHSHTPHIKYGEWKNENAVK